MGALLCAPLPASAVGWFQTNTSLTQAHQHLLDGDLPAMFTSLVEVWQQQKSSALESHLNDLLIQSLAVDCGKGLETTQAPEWIKSILVRRTEIQNPRRDTYRVNVEVHTTEALSDVRLTKWVDRSISANDEILSVDRSQIAGSDEKTYVKRYNLNNRLSAGLYRLNILTEDDKEWSTWLLIGDAKAKSTVRWTAKDQWLVEKNAFLNKHCPLPKLNVALYDYIDSSYHLIWSKTYESGYPEQLEAVKVTPDRYILAVSMTHQRWQGPILIERTQMISKNYDVTNDE